MLRRSRIGPSRDATLDGLDQTCGKLFVSSSTDAERSIKILTMLTLPDVPGTTRPKR